MCVFTECSLMPSWRAISFVLIPRATSARIALCRSDRSGSGERDAITALAHVHPQTPPTTSQSAPRSDTQTERPSLAARPFGSSATVV